MTPTTYGRDFAYCLKSHGGVRGFNASLWRFLLRCTLFCHSVATFLTSVSSYEGGCGFEVVVKDKTENTSVTIRVKVVDSYLGLQLGKPIPNYSVYNEDDRLYLVNNKSKSFYLYDKSFNLKATGNYKLFVKNSNYFLSLVFSDKVCFYNISNSSHAFLWGAIPTYLEFLWTNEGLTTTNARDVSPVVMTAFDLDTNNVYYFNVDSTEFPYGILN